MARGVMIIVKLNFQNLKILVNVEKMVVGGIMILKNVSQMKINKTITIPDLTNKLNKKFDTKFFYK